MKTSSWFVRGIYFVASLIFVRWVSRVRLNTPWWALPALAILSAFGVVIWGLVK